MAVTVTQTVQTPQWAVWDIIAALDADTTATLNHSFSVVPFFVTLDALLTNFYVSQWIITSRSATQIVVTKGVGVGSGAAGAQLRVIAGRTVEQPF